MRRVAGARGARCGGARGTGRARAPRGARAPRDGRRRRRGRDVARAATTTTTRARDDDARDDARAVYDATYDALGLDRDAGLAIAERADRAKTREDEWFYGELEFAAARDALRRVCPNAEERREFVDLGSGLGKMVIVAALSGLFERARGVELLTELHEAATRARAAFDDALARGDGDVIEGARACEVTLDEGDLLNYDVSSADVVYIHATCFTPQLLSALALKLASELKTGARVMIMSKQFPEGWVFKPFDGGYAALAQPQSKWKLDCFLYEISR